MMCSDPENWSVPDEEVPWRQPKDAKDVKDNAVMHRQSFTLRTELEPHLMRGVPLSTCMSGWAKHWAGQHGSSMYQTESNQYSLSSVVSFYHCFLSHDWRTSRSAKLCALLVIFNSRAACYVSVLGAVGVGVAVGTSVLPFNIFTAICVPYIVYVLFLSFWQRLRSVCCPLMVFLDRLCIAQHDPHLKEQGIMGLAAFLDISKELTILWSPRYLSRLWCVYELATYMRHPGQVRPVHVMPTSMAVLVLLTATIGMVSIGFYTALINGGLVSGNTGNGVRWHILGPTMGWVALFGGIVIPVITYIGIGMMQDVQSLPDQLSSFSVRKTECFCCSNDHKHPLTGAELQCDRRLVYKMLKHWYSVEHDLGEEFLDRFDETVQARLSHVVRDGAVNAILPFRYCFYIGCMASAPLLADAVGEAIAKYQDGEDTSITAARTLVLVTVYWLRMVAVFLLYVWLQMNFCKLGVYLAKRIPRAAAAAVLFPVLLLSETIVWGLIQISYVYVREAVHGETEEDYTILNTLVRIFFCLACLSLGAYLCGASRALRCVERGVTQNISEAQNDDAS